MSTPSTRSGRLFAAALCLTAASAGFAAAGENHFLVLFGSESDPWRPKYTHTFASLVRASGDGPDPSAYQLVVHTGSWLPLDGDVKVWKLRADPGRNFRLHETLDLVASTGQTVQQWGPYPIRPVSYWRGIERIAQLESSTLDYRAIDTPLRKKVGNCFHAISDLDPSGNRLEYPLWRAGHRITKDIARVAYQEGVLLDVCGDYGWVSGRMGLEGYPIVRQRLEVSGPPNPNARTKQIHASPPRVPAFVPPPDMVIPGRP